MSQNHTLSIFIYCGRYHTITIKGQFPWITTKIKQNKFEIVFLVRTYELLILECEVVNKIRLRDIISITCE